ncbi:hypothetical protein ScalyP_jg11233 [Parmales sp. scaly parma]|nr:hypothetical protein ScalyP_jg11233 [Parmales sp. scaly parma]
MYLKEPSSSPKSCIRLFVAGDRSQVGKSSVCIGILQYLLNSGFLPIDLAYIKPATQCEEQQPIQLFCEEHSIACVPVGPIVYYKGFTREFLKGSLGSSEALLQTAKQAVDNICANKKICLIDGVGYPAVGSITGTSNADVCKICNASVMLVGRSGVGDAVDSFNLNASYFESQGIEVVGVVFNKLSMSGYYTLENCSEAVTSYFDSKRKSVKVVGFVPQLEGDFGVKEFCEIFMEYCDVGGLFERLKGVGAGGTTPIATPTPTSKTRSEIEQVAKAQGATGS